MAWICFELDDTLVQKQPLSDELDAEEQEPLQEMPVEGAPEALQQLAAEGHRLTVVTARFQAMPASEKQRVKEEIEETLQMLGFPEMEVWTGTFKPAADLFVGRNEVTFDDDWGLALAQVQQMLEDKGLAAEPVPGAAEQDLMQEQPGAEVYGTGPADEENPDA